MYGFRNNEKYAHISIASRDMKHPSYSSNNNDYSICYHIVKKTRAVSFPSSCLKK